MIATRATHRNRSLFSALFALLLAACPGWQQATAQAVTLVPSAARYAGIGTNNKGFNADFGPAGTVELNGPVALAFDTTGQMLIADSQNNCVRRIDATSQHLMTTVAGLVTSGGDTCNTASNSGPSATQGLLTPSGVAVDSSNNIYVADTGHNCVRQLTPGSTGVANMITVAGTCGAGSRQSSTPTPSALATDANGNLYIVTRDTAIATYEVLRLNSGTLCRVAGAASATGVNVPQCGDVAGTLPTLRIPSGVAVDATGAMYVADTGDNCVRKLANGVFSTAAGTCGSVTSSIPSPTSVAFSKAGSMYISLSDNNQVVRYNQLTGAQLLIAGNSNETPGPYAATQDGAASSAVPLNSPAGLVEDGSNNLYLADSGNSIVREFAQGNLFPNTVVGQASAQQSLVFQINVSGVLSVTPGQDYAIAAGSDTCTGVQTAAAPGATPAYCTVGVIFQPTQPGPRYSPLTVTNTAATPLTVVTAGLQGIGQGPIGELFPGQANTFASGLGTVIDVGRDSSDNVYVLHKPAVGLPELLRYPSGGGTPTVVIAAGAGMKNPQAIARDAGGNWYVADLAGSSTGAASVQRYAADGTTNVDYVTGLDTPKAVDVDGFGNLLIVQQGASNNLLKVYAGGERQVVTGGGTTLASGSGGVNTGDGTPASGMKLGLPTGVALGSDGTIYLSDAGTHFVYSIDVAGLFHYLAGTGSASGGTSQSALSQALISPQDVEVDAGNDVFIVDAAANSVYTVFASSPATNNIRRLLGTGAAGDTGDGTPSNAATLNSPQAVTITPDGLVYVADSGNGAVRDVTFPSATLDFGTVAEGSITTQPQSLWNPGNYVLLRTGDPTVSNPLFAYDSADSTCGSAILGGLRCDLDFTFSPTAPGQQTGTATVADDVANSPQTIHLKGNVIAALITGFSAPAETEPYGGPYVGTVVVTTNGGTIPYGTLTFSVAGGGTTVSCTVTGAVVGTVSCTLPNGTGLSVAGSPYTVTVTFHDTNGNYPDQHATTTLTETTRTLTETVNNKSKVYLQPNPVLDGTPNGILPGIGSDSFAVNYGFGATQITTTTLPGTYTNDIVATITPIGSTNAANYTVTSVPGTFTVLPASFSAFGANAATEVYGGAYSQTASYTAPSGGVTPTGNVTFKVNGTTLCTLPVAPSVTCSLSGGTNLQAGNYTVTVSYSGDRNYTAANYNAALTVTPAPLTVTVANQSKAFGAPVPTLTGTVTGLVNGDTVGGTILLTYATTVTTTTPIGTYPNSITATVGGSSVGSYTITNVPGSFVVTGIATTTTLISSGSPVAAGSAVTLTAHVTSTGTQVPTGQVVFTAGSTTLGTGTLDGTGTATLTTTTLPAGTLTIVAAYGGNANFAASSGQITEVVTAPVGTFVVSVSPDSSLIRGAGSTTLNVTVSSSGGFAGPVTLACSGLPVDATCAIGTQTLTIAANGTASTTVTATTTLADATVSSLRAPVGPGAPSNWPGAFLITAAAAFPMQLSGLGLMAAGIRRRKGMDRKRRNLLLAVLLGVGLMGLAGCGCPSTAYHIYPVTITGTSVNGGPAPVSTTVYLTVGTP